MSDNYRPEVGEKISLNMAADVPAGTKVWDTSQARVRIRDDHSSGWTFEDQDPTPVPFLDRLYLVLSVPSETNDLTDPSQLTEELWKVRNSAVPTEFVQERRNPSQTRIFEAVAEFVLENFVIKDSHPDRIVDGEGDNWYLSTNGFYFHAKSADPSINRNREFASLTMEDVREEYGITTIYLKAGR